MTAVAYVITCALGITCAAIGVRRRSRVAYGWAAVFTLFAIDLMLGGNPAVLLVVYGAVALSALGIATYVAFAAWRNDIPTDDAP